MDLDGVLSSSQRVGVGGAIDPGDSRFGARRDQATLEGDRPAVVQAGEPPADVELHHRHIGPYLYVVAVVPLRWLGRDEGRVDLSAEQLL